MTAMVTGTMGQFNHLLHQGDVFLIGQPEAIDHYRGIAMLDALDDGLIGTAMVDMEGDG